jgi:hypothetical protein
MLDATKEGMGRSQLRCRLRDRSFDDGSRDGLESTLRDVESKVVEVIVNFSSLYFYSICLL